MTSSKAVYQRVLIKLSGEAFMGDSKFGIEHSASQTIAQSIQTVYELGVQIGIVVGGGNIFRGAQSEAFGFSRTPSDHIGMLATTINGLILQQTLMSLGVETRVMSALDMDRCVERYNWGHAQHCLQKGIPVIFVGGTGNPYFTTDSAAALRASEMSADVLLKATKVDGVYSEDPLKNPRAVKYTTLSYADALAQNLNVMDATAIALCRENKIPIRVFNLFEQGALLKAVCGQEVGSLVH